ncbi:hypothetical protein ACFX1T_020030 [Malus domestica]
MTTSFSSHQENPLPKMVQFPLDPASYQIRDEVGSGVSVVVSKAICFPMNSAIVAIKFIDRDQSGATYDFKLIQVFELHVNIYTCPLRKEISI